MIIWKTGFSFESAHNLAGECFGKCQNLHGHSYQLHVGVRGTPNSSGMIMNFTELSAIVKSEILDVLDHQFLNEAFKAFENVKGYQPATTCETMALVIKNHLEAIIKKKYDNVDDVYVRLWETKDSYAEVF